MAMTTQTEQLKQSTPEAETPPLPWATIQIFRNNETVTVIFPQETPAPGKTEKESQD